ncbi:neurogenin-3-like [Limulus polyphemus]|uniref:Neurogenin-3-like n=1 Tax=Limulus polyphemus TaxID=6850 RepID=A0ABM1B8G8_LIMPO|nr:neurogenin-3-like [Limulus polyphemus]
MAVDLVDFDPNSWESLLSLNTNVIENENLKLHNNCDRVELPAIMCITPKISVEDEEPSSPKLSNTSVASHENSTRSSDCKTKEDQQAKTEEECKEIKYKLRPRSIQKRKELEIKRHCKKEPKPKQKPPPLSKYRRRTANARERYRMEKMNQAFEQLRQAIPQFPNAVGMNNSKLTKITTLRLAVNYIAALADILRKTDCNDKEQTTEGPSQVVDSTDLNLDIGSDGCDLTVDDLTFLLDSDEDSMEYTTDLLFP